jgi:tetratricopeptide (TPR) repeat protein
MLCLAGAGAIGATGWALLGGAAPAPLVMPATPPAEAPVATTAAAALQAARRQCTAAALDAAVARCQARVATSPAAVESWRELAEALLERSLQRTHLRGIRVGTPLFDVLPPELAADLSAGLAAVARARELGDDGSDLYRIEAALMGQHITGLASALQWNPRIEAALGKAAERKPDDPRLHTLLGLRKLLAPRLFGHDARRALQHFEFAARSLHDDERPAVFAAMASHLQRQGEQAVAWLEQAVARNPRNTFARVVLRRLRGGDAEPFGRDVTAEEVAAAH